MEISQLEASILLKLSEVILQEVGRLEAAMTLVCELDCVLAMAMVSQENGWRRPNVVQDGNLGNLLGVVHLISSFVLEAMASLFYVLHCPSLS